MTTLLSDKTREHVQAVRERAGIWIRHDHTFIRFEGRDVASWLQTQTSNDVVALQSGCGHAGTLLDRKGRLQAHFTLHRWEDEYWMLIEKQQAPRLLEQLDAHLFLEDVHVEDAGDSLEQVVVQGPKTLPFLASPLDTDEGTASIYLPRQRHGCHPLELLGCQVLAFNISVSGEDGYVLVAQAGEAQALVSAILERGRGVGLTEVGEEAREVLRIEAGIPRFGLDMDTTNRMPETTLERDGVSYDKGCYLGQEVVAKLRAYSSVKFALCGLILPPALQAYPQLNAPVIVDGQTVGTVKSGAYSPTLRSWICLAYLDREHRAPGSALAFAIGPEGAAFQAEVAVLPFYAAPTREERAAALYEQALAHFESDEHDEDTAAIEWLKEAVLLHPGYEDAYEALGVILHRHHRVDEAIHYMKILEELNPDCVMAHTNLSVFYVSKGMIEEAEEEKAKAAVAQMRLARDSHRAEAMAAEERERIRREARERMEMFREVLEIDPDDPLATFGMGMAHIQVDEYESALPYLRRATQVQKDYSVAFLNLGKCLEFLKRIDEAAVAYRSGIEAAGRKGDLVPLREMERRLKSLGVTQTN
ncbi:MAG: tetratricopeptide repeat protein [Candidatus Hydrogenedentes bacterium]|nr:tetratricopeptide repeat protein [Candidatus Hydrogenedentota bacterium]